MRCRPVTDCVGAHDPSKSELRLWLLELVGIEQNVELQIGDGFSPLWSPAFPSRPMRRR